MVIFISLIVPKNVKGFTLLAFSTSIQLQKSKKEGPFGDIRNISENKTRKAVKGGKSHSAK